MQYHLATALEIPGVGIVTDLIVGVGKSLLLLLCDGVKVICPFVGVLSMLWLLMNHDSKIAKEGAIGSIVIYIAMKAVEVSVS